MKTSDVDYHLPPDRIAQHPAEPRDAARLLVLRRDEGGRIQHSCVRNLPDWLAPGDLLVVNNTRVIPARMTGRKAGTGGKVEVFFIEPGCGPDEWEVLIQAHRRPRPGTRILLGTGIAEAVFLEDRDRGRARIRMVSPVPVFDLLEAEGDTPLPPYIRRDLTNSSTARNRDRADYQTVYASRPGAVAAPTAGLHFTPALFEALEARGVRRATVTLHVGPGTFRPVQTEWLADHPMESERFEVDEDCARRIRETKDNGGRVIAVGSTSVRTLETVADGRGGVRAESGRTSLFIRPPFPFRVVDAMLTNFHLPRSTLLAMVCALAGREPVLRAYAEAVREDYRFYSFGDAMLIL